MIDIIKEDASNESYTLYATYNTELEPDIWDMQEIRDDWFISDSEIIDRFILDNDGYYYAIDYLYSYLVSITPELSKQLGCDITVIPTRAWEYYDNEYIIPVFSLSENVSLDKCKEVFSKIKIPSFDSNSSNSIEYRDSAYDTRWEPGYGSYSFSIDFSVHFTLAVEDMEIDEY